MLKRIHVNQHKIRSNKKNNECEPVLTVKTYKSNEYCHDVDILDKDGNVLATLMYRPHKPLSCGATVWLECYGDIQIRDQNTKLKKSTKKEKFQKCVFD